MTITPTTPAAELYVDEFMITAAGSFARPLLFSTDDERVYPENPQFGERAGTVVVRIGVDLDHDQVAIDQEFSSQIGLLEAAISDLQRVRDTLADLTSTASEGRCMNGADWGRCLLQHDHEGACEGQTEAQWKATQEVFAAARARRAARAG